MVGKLQIKVEEPRSRVWLWSKVLVISS